MKKIIIGTRGSQLSLVQTNLIKDHLQSLLPQTLIEIKIITTKGDKNMNPVPLDSVGKGWFTKEIDKALLAGEIDMAVHSLKDLSEILPKGLVIAALPIREDAREALVARSGLPLLKLKKGSVIGTDSTRRKAQILHKRPDLIVESIRGNVNRRLEKLDNGEYDAVFLAVAGLKRLGLTSRITEYFDETDIIPSPGQGALAVVIRKSNTALYTTLKKLNDPTTVAAVKAERAFSKAIGGGCKMPVGAYAKIVEDTIIMHAVVGSLDGTYLEIDSIKGSILTPAKLGKIIASRLLETCKNWYIQNDPIPPAYVVITRPLEDDTFAKEIKDMGLQPLLYPTIEITKNTLLKNSKDYLHNLAPYDWLLFTSRHGVRYFLETLAELEIDPQILQKKHIGAVGPKTAEELKKHQLTVQFIPSEFTTEDLANQLPEINGKRILLPRSDIATPILAEQLEKRGATVVTVPIYKTEFVTKPNAVFEQQLSNNTIQCITFTSPSTVEGFLASIDSKRKSKVLSLPVVAIGPVTAKAVQEKGFTTIYTADTYTTEGMLTKLKEIILK